MTPLSEQFLDRLASAAVQEGLADAVYTTLKTPIGPLLVVQGERGVLRIAFEGEPEDVTLAGVAAGVGPRIVRSDRELAGTRDALSAYLEGDDETLALPVDLSLARGPFRRTVLDTLHREVHRGEVVTYGELAAAGRQPARGARGRHRLRDEPGADRRTLPPRAARLAQARQLRRRARAQAGPADARRRPLEGLSRYRAAAAPAGGARAAGGLPGRRDADRHVRAGAAAARRARRPARSPPPVAWWPRSGSRTRSAPSPRGG